MKQTIQQLFKGIQKLTWLFALYDWIVGKCNALRSLWIGAKFKECPTSTYFEKLGNLIGPQYISIKGNCFIQRGTYLTAIDFYHGQSFRPEIYIGRNCNIGAHNHITCVNKIAIGSGFLSGKWVTITDNSHGLSDIEDLKNIPAERILQSKGPVIIGKNVWVGEKVTILPGLTIGDGVVIAANSVVAKDIPSYCVVAGVPAKIVKSVK